MVGNKMVDWDSITLRIAPTLRKIFKGCDFIELEPEEDINPVDDEVNIIDAATGIDDVKLINDIDRIKGRRIYSMHDFGIDVQLKLLIEIKKIKKINIIAIPYNMDEKEALKKVANIISTLC